MYLDDLQPTSAYCGYGDIGYGGLLGYNNHLVDINGEFFSRSFSAHPPSSLSFELDGSWQSLFVEVAVNGTTVDDRFSDFSVFADDLLVAYIPNVTKKDGKRKIGCNLRGAKRLRLVSSGGGHSVWIDPKLNKKPIDDFRGCLSHLWITRQQKDSSKKVTVMTTITPSYLKLFRTMMASLSEHGVFDDVQFVALSFESTPEVERFCLENNVIEYKCTDYAMKTAIGKKLITHSIPHVCDSQYFLFLDCDMLFKADVVHELVNTLTTLDDNSMLITKEHGMNNFVRVHEAAGWIYDSSKEDMRSLGLEDEVLNSRVVVNTGVYGGSRQAFFAVEDTLKRMFPMAERWEAHKPGSIREQMLTNVALVKLNNAVFVKDEYNYQIHPQLNKVKSLDDVFNLPAKTLHFNGASRALLDGYVAKSKLGFKRTVDCETFIATTAKTFASDLAPSKPIIRQFIDMLSQVRAHTLLEVSPGNGILSLNAAFNGINTLVAVNGMNGGLQDVIDNSPDKIRSKIHPVFMDHMAILKLAGENAKIEYPSGSIESHQIDVFLIDALAMFNNKKFIKTAGTQIDLILRELLARITTGQYLVVYATRSLLESIEENIPKNMRLSIYPVAKTSDPTLGVVILKPV